MKWLNKYHKNIIKGSQIVDLSKGEFLRIVVDGKIALMISSMEPDNPGGHWSFYIDYDKEKGTYIDPDKEYEKEGSYQTLELSRLEIMLRV